jgi:hypothetical protein
MEDTFSGLLRLTDAAGACWWLSREFVDQFREQPLLSTNEWTARSQAAQLIRIAEQEREQIREHIQHFEESDDSLSFVEEVVGRALVLPDYSIGEYTYATCHEAGWAYATKVVESWRSPDCWSDPREFLSDYAKILEEIPQFPDQTARLSKEHNAAAELTTLGDDEAVAEVTTQVGDDDSAYRPASEFVARDCRNYKEFQKILKDNGSIRKRNPSPQRLEVHAGDWMKYMAAKAKAGFDSLDIRGEVVDEIQEQANRQAELRLQKQQAGETPLRRTSRLLP